MKLFKIMINFVHFALDFLYEFTYNTVLNKKKERFIMRNIKNMFNCQFHMFFAMHLFAIRKDSP